MTCDPFPGSAHAYLTLNTPSPQHHTDYAVYLVLEFMRGGDLLQHIIRVNSFTEQDAARITYQVASTLEYLHARGVIHRDLKPDNLIFRTHNATSDVVVADFGLAKRVVTGIGARSLCGTPLYLAPEMIRQPRYGPECDFWSLGVILYVMLSGRPPFYASNQKRLFDRICAGRFDFKPEEDWKHISPEAKDLIKKLLVVDPSARFNAQKIRSHPWLAATRAEGRKRAISALTHPHFRRRVRLLIGKQKLRKGVAFLIQLNRFFAFINVESLKKAWEVKGLRRSSAQVLARLPSADEWADVKAGLRRVQSLEASVVKPAPGVRVLVRAAGRGDAHEAILMRRCSVIRAPGMWWVWFPRPVGDSAVGGDATSSSSSMQKPGRVRVEDVSRMVATKSSPRDAKTPKSPTDASMWSPVDPLRTDKKTLFDNLNSNPASKPPQTDSTLRDAAGDVGAVGLLDGLLRHSIALRGARLQLMELVSSKEKQAIAFWNQVRWFKAAHSHAERGTAEPRDAVWRDAMDIWMPYLNPKAFMYLSHLSGEELTAVSDQLLNQRVANRGMFDRLLTANAEYLRRHSFRHIWEALLVCVQFWTDTRNQDTKTSTDVNDRDVQSLIENIPDDLWETLGTEACSFEQLDSTPNRRKMWKEGSVEKRHRGRFSLSTWSKRIIRIHAVMSAGSSAAGTLPRAHLSYHSKRPRRGSKDANIAMSIPLAHARVRVTRAKRTIYVEGRDKAGVATGLCITFRTATTRQCDEWASALRAFQQTQSAKIAFAKRVLAVTKRLLTANSLRKLCSDVKNDPLRSACALFGKDLIRRGHRLINIRRLLNTAIMKTIQDAIGSRWDPSFALALSSVLALWATILSESTPQWDASRGRSKKAGLSPRRGLNVPETLPFDGKTAPGDHKLHVDSLPASTITSATGLTTSATLAGLYSFAGQRGVPDRARSVE